MVIIIEVAAEALVALDVSLAHFSTLEDYSGEVFYLDVIHMVWGLFDLEMPPLLGVSLEIPR